MLYARPYYPSRLGAANLAIEKRVGPSPQKAQHLGRTKLFPRLLAEGGINLRPGFPTPKHHVRGVFPLPQIGVS
jgi:hypothetical protein